ncbi:hypothetical protein D1AOALGA4SA_7153 [Olavius algarvensis Delta 1 endosymbiont]|nr:hypothetical protein D1AOALGA4SA_7153 [Olavius algarvensis Delta 1 endosymbiont]
MYFVQCACSNPKSDDRGQKTEDPSSLSELRRGTQKSESEDRRQKSDDRSQMTEDRGQTADER